MMEVLRLLNLEDDTVLRDAANAPVAANKDDDHDDEADDERVASNERGERRGFDADASRGRKCTSAATAATPDR